MKHIMVIDDSLTTRKILEMVLQHQGYCVTCFAEPLESLRYMRDPGKPPPDCFMIDLMLPGIDGFDLISFIRRIEVYQNTPIFVISVKDGVTDRIKARIAGAQGYIVKPFKTQEVIALLQKYF